MSRISLIEKKCIPKTEVIFTLNYVSTRSAWNKTNVR